MTTGVNMKTSKSTSVIRSGGWYLIAPSRVRASYRYWYARKNWHFDLGFRCALRGREPVEVKP